MVVSGIRESAQPSQRISGDWPWPNRLRSSGSRRLVRWAKSLLPARRCSRESIAAAQCQLYLGIKQRRQGRGFQVLGLNSEAMPRILVCNDAKIVRFGLSEVRRAIDIGSHLFKGTEYFNGWTYQFLQSSVRLVDFFFSGARDRWDFSNPTEYGVCSLWRYRPILLMTREKAKKAGGLKAAIWK